VKNRLGSVANPGEHLFTAINTALINDGLFLHIPREVRLEAPIEVFWLNSASDAPLLAQPRNLVILEPGAHAVLIEHHLPGRGSHYFHNAITEIVLDPGARLSHYRVQDESSHAWHMSNLALDQGSDSHYHGITLAFGGRLARTEYNARFTAEGAQCTLRGLYTVGDDQLQDFHLDVQHDVPRCASREQFKGLLYGKGRAVFDGRILVAPDAQKSDAELTNDNLLLTRNAEVDTKPQLEIYADDVKASHGTTVGQLEQEQVFYLRARGIPEQRAVHMLCEGFAAEIVEHIEVELLRDQALARLRRTLAELD
jgi:Fe-S cluster assembly protein SufD